MTEPEYIRAVRVLYLSLPLTHRRFSRTDRELAAAFYKRGVPFDSIRSALLLATARRIFRDPAAFPLTPVRSLHYFLHTINEITRRPLPALYVQHLEYRLAQAASAPLRSS